MKKSRFARGHVFGFAGSAVVALALISCGSVAGAGSAISAGSEAAGDAIRFVSSCVAPVEGSPEEAALANGHCSSSWWRAAPTEGSPEQTVADRGR
jgi:hypothetical protein